MKRWGWLVCLLLSAGLSAQEATVEAHTWADPAKIKGGNTCKRCHVSAYNVWEDTAHAKGFKTLHRQKAARAIAKKMGVNLIKRDSLCLSCHYTPVIEDNQVRAGSGVSCESCHGAALDWVEIHNKYGGKGVTHETESEQHRAHRIEETRRLGMKRPSDLYPVAARCFQCHTVPNEALVNTGGHSLGSADFEFVAWSQGKMRHNFFDSFLNGDGTVNEERPIARKRIMYVLGRALDVEYTIRALAVAKNNKRYFRGLSRRLRVAIGELRTIKQLHPLPECDRILALVKDARILPDNPTELVALAQQIGREAQTFLSTHDGRQLAALDPLLRGEDVSHLLTARQPPTVIQPAPPSSPTQPNQAPHNPSTATTKTVNAGPTANKAAPLGPEGTYRQKIRTHDSFNTIGPGQCSSCHRHENQSIWWFEDAHYRAADPFFNAEPKYLAVATTYGITPADLTRGDTVCMDCHGTVVSGREAREVNDGVGCEACHGGAADYVEIHREGDGKGRRRSGYLKALGLGMRDLSVAETVAKTCADCHYITDKRLLSSGHHSGSDFKLPAAMAAIKHWSHETRDPKAQTAYAQIRKQRGPIPKVRLAVQPKNEPSVSQTSKPQVANTEQTRKPTPQPAKTTSAAPLPAHRVTTPNPRPKTKQKKNPIILPEFPEITDDTPIHEILLHLQERMKELYRQTHGADQ